jgi:YidC/Oxa1 family membrane protein insertase
MGIMFYKVAAGLCIYFIASSIWGIAERKLVPKPAPGALVPAGNVDLPAGRGSRNGATLRDSRPKKKR